RVDDLKMRPAVTGRRSWLLDTLAESLDQGLVGGLLCHMHSGHIFRNSKGEAQRAFAHAVPADDRNDDAQWTHFPHLQGFRWINFFRDSLVVMMDAGEHGEKRRHDQDRNP